VALGNTDYDPENVQVLTHKLTCLTNHNFKAYGFSNEPNAAVQSMLHEHLTWALAEQQQAQNKKPVTNRQQARIVRIVAKGLPRDAYL
jgi:hypothetical protein